MIKFHAHGLLLVKTVRDRPSRENINYEARVNLDGLLGRV